MVEYRFIRVDLIYSYDRIQCTTTIVVVILSMMRDVMDFVGSLGFVRAQ